MTNHVDQFLMSKPESSPFYTDMRKADAALDEAQRTEDAAKYAAALARARAKGAKRPPSNGGLDKDQVFNKEKESRFLTGGTAWMRAQIDVYWQILRAHGVGTDDVRVRPIADALPLFSSCAFGVMGCLSLLSLKP